MGQCGNFPRFPCPVTLALPGRVELEPTFRQQHIGVVVNDVSAGRLEVFREEVGIEEHESALALQFTDASATARTGASSCDSVRSNSLLCRLLSWWPSVVSYRRAWLRRQAPPTLQLLRDYRQFIVCKALK